MKDLYKHIKYKITLQTLEDNKYATSLYKILFI